MLPAEEPQRLGLSTEALGRLDKALGAGIGRGRMPGAVGLIARRGQVAWFEAQGRLGPQSETAMSKDAIFRIFSMTKPIVSVAVMRLVEEGKLLLTDFLHRYIPEFAARKTAVEGASGLELVPAPRGITIHDLLRHTSGIAYDFVATGAVQKLYAEAGLHRRGRTNEEFVKTLAGLPLFHDPGTSWDYSFSTDVLGRIVEIISGKSLRDFLMEEILLPLGMTDTDFFVPPEKHHRIAEPFPKDVDSGAASGLFEPRTMPALQSGGGGLLSTATDYARFLQMLLNGGSLGDIRILGRKTVDLMTANHLGLGVKSASDLLPPGYGFGLGFAVRTERGLADGPGSIGQYFWGGIAGTTFFVDPQEELFALLMIQSPGQREYYRMLFRNLVYATLD